MKVPVKLSVPGHSLLNLGLPNTKPANLRPLTDLKPSKNSANASPSDLSVSFSKMQSEESEDRVTSFLNLLLGIDSGAMIFLLISRFDPGGIQLPASLPLDIPPPHHELSFGWQVVALGICAATILILRAFSLWKYRKYKRIARYFSVVILTVTLVTIGTAGCKVLKNPELLKEGEQKQKGTE
jgi:hypothetical protein